MKRIFLCALAACFVLTACEIQNPVEIPDVPAASGVSGDPAFGSSSKDSILFSANLGADTKTYLEYDGYGFYKQLWSENDQILIWDGNTLEDGEKAVYEFCDIYKGVGTTSASFFGTLETDFYVALYAGYPGYPQDGFPIITLPTEQYRNRVNNLTDFAYPMIAISDSRELNFDNMCSILKLSVTGNGELISCITAYSQAGEPMSGPVAVDVDTETLKPVIEFLGESESDGVYSFVDLYCNYSESLSSSPTEFYIVVPAQVYEEGIGFTLITDDGLIMDVTTAAGIETKRSQVHEINISFEATGDANSWALIGSASTWATDIPLTYSDGIWTLSSHHLMAGEEFKFRANGTWDYNLGVMSGENQVLSAGTKMHLETNGSNIVVGESGYYNLYLDTNNNILGVELAGSDAAPAEVTIAE